MKIFSSLLFTFFYLVNIQAQVIPEALRVDWSKAGYEGEIPQPSNIINVRDFGALGDSLHDDYNAVVNAINSSSGLRCIYFPAGKYTLKSTLELPSNVVLRGEGTSTVLYFNLTTGIHSILVSALQSTAFTPILSGYSKGSTTITVSNTTGFTVNGFAEIREMNGSWDTKPVSNAAFSVGQMVRIKTISGDQLIIDAPLRIDYAASLNPEIRPVTMKENVGIECLKISRIDAPAGYYGSNIYFSYSTNSWVSGVESDKSQATHLLVSYSSHITVSGSYFHDAFGYTGDGTSGYGATLITHSGDCKIENNIFQRLRHAMVAKQGANGNVFAYNYSIDPKRTEIPGDAGGDLLLHGHYPYANLFEGNIAQNLVVSDTWGQAGPYNTFFRNRLDLYGINISGSTSKQNIVGNEVTNTGLFKGMYNVGGNPFVYGNNIKGSVLPTGTNLLNDQSYYLLQPPTYWTLQGVWPSLGIPNAISLGTNPAKERFLAEGSKISCFSAKPLNLTITADSILCSGGISTVTLKASGGTGNYLYSKDGVVFQQSNVFNAAAGNYYFVVKDGISTKSINVNITAPLPLSATYTPTKVSACNGVNDGTIKVKASGGTKPYKYFLNNGKGQPSNPFTNLAPGTYNLWVKDYNKCLSLITPVTVIKADSLIAKVSKTPASCENGSDGSLTIKATGGIAPYMYSIDGINFQVNKVFYNLSPGYYSAVVKDSRNCTSVPVRVRILSTEIPCPSLAKNIFSGMTNNLSVYPNPSSSEFSIGLQAEKNNVVHIKVTDLTGREIENKILAPNRTTFGKNLQPGVYFLEIISGNNRKLVRIIKQ